MVNAILRIIAFESKLPFVQFELGSGDAIPIKHIVNKIKRLCHSESKLLFGVRSYRRKEPMLTKANTEFIKKLGWKNQNSLDIDLKYTIEQEKRLEIMDIK